MARSITFKYTIFYGDKALTEQKALPFEVEDDEYELMRSAAESSTSFEDTFGLSELKRDLMEEIIEQEAENPLIRQILDYGQYLPDLIRISVNWSEELKFND